MNPVLETLDHDYLSGVENPENFEANIHAQVETGGIESLSRSDRAIFKTMQVNDQKGKINTLAKQASKNTRRAVYTIIGSAVFSAGGLAAFSASITAASVLTIVFASATLGSLLSALFFIIIPIMGVATVAILLVLTIMGSISAVNASRQFADLKGERTALAQMRVEEKNADALNTREEKTSKNLRRAAYAAISSAICSTGGVATLASSIAVGAVLIATASSLTAGVLGLTAFVFLVPIVGVVVITSLLVLTAISSIFVANALHSSAPA